MIRSNSRLKTKTAVTRIMSAKKTMAEHCLFTSSQWFSSSGCIPSALNGYFSFSDLVWKVNSRLRVDRLSNQCSFTRKISVSWEKKIVVITDYSVCVLHVIVYLDLFDRPGERSLRRSDWRFNILGGGHLQSQLTIGIQTNVIMLCSVLCVVGRNHFPSFCVLYTRNVFLSRLY